MERVTSGSSFLLSVLGINLPVESSFKLKLTGYTNTDEVEIFLTELMDADLTALELQTILLRFIDDVTVTLGNPVESDQLVGVLSPDPPDPLRSGMPQSLTGQWLITFPASLLETYSSLLLTVEEAEYAGLSVVVARATLDVVTEATEIVTDVYNRPSTHPWQAGSIVICVPMMDTGYSILSSDYRDITQN